ncbi:MAG: EAL domain-containing protein, partial [Planctomycetota bacterium]
MSHSETPQYIAPAWPLNERERQAELDSLHVLGTESEWRFDRFTSLAASLFDVPMAVVSLVDRDRQWFKSGHGLEACETTRDVSFCGHTIQENEVMIIPDAAKDERFTGNPLVTGELNIQSYAGAILRGPRGHAVGTLCILDTKPREYSTFEIKKLTEMAVLVQEELEREARFERLREDVEYREMFDSRSGLPNQNHTRTRLEHVLKAAHESGRRAFIARIEIAGYARCLRAGGELGAGRLLGEFGHSVCDSLPEGAIVGRWQDAELMAACILPAQEQAAERIAAAVIDMAQRIRERNLTRAFETRIGIALSPHDGDSLDTLLTSSAVALDEARDAGPGSYRCYAADQEERAQRHQIVDGALRTALAGRGLRMMYQPKVDVRERLVHGAEALLRWQDPNLGPVSPAEFIPIIENTSLMLDLGRWVLHETCRQVAEWRAEGIETVPIAVNVSTSQLQDDCFAEEVAWIVHEAGLEPKHIELEVTESSIFEDVDEALSQMRALKEKGFRFSLDDFGTGYSSLSYLQSLPVSSLKVDRSFV